jgi:predicted GIY-YIG superfamily endonuclease
MTEATSTVTTATSRPAAVYRLYDTEGTLLYIGSAYDPKERAKKHREKPWWPQVARREDEWHPSREAAYVAETEAIKDARPLGNKISGPGAVATPAPKAVTKTAVPLFVLAEIDAYFDQVAEEPPAVRFRRLTELMEALEEAVFARRRAVFQEMRASGMTYRQIGEAVGLSFARVRQILTAE